MLAKLTSKNQLTLPKQVVDALGRPSHFSVEFEDGRLVLVPARTGSASAVRRKLAELGIDEAVVAEAVTWAKANAAR